MARMASVEDAMSAVQDALDRISYKDGYEFRGVAIRHSEYDHSDMAGELWLIRVEKPNNIDVRTGGTRHSIGRWFVTMEHDADSVARTCLVAIKNFEEHEVHEWLRLDGERIFNPHGGG